MNDRHGIRANHWRQALALSRNRIKSFHSGAPPMIVMKFGGTSVEDAKAIDRVAVIVQGRLAAARGRGQRHGQSDRHSAHHGAKPQAMASAKPR